MIITDRLEKHSRLSECSNHVCSDHRVSDGHGESKETLCHVDKRWDMLNCNEMFLLLPK